MSELNHPNIINCLEHFTEKGICYLVMEYAEFGDLYQYAIDKTQLDQDQIVNILW